MTRDALGWLLVGIGIGIAAGILVLTIERESSEPLRCTCSCYNGEAILEITGEGDDYGEDGQ